jgi:hypothetical protein
MKMKKEKGVGKASRRVQDWKVHAGVYKGAIFYHSPTPRALVNPWQWEGGC